MEPKAKAPSPTLGEDESRRMRLKVADNIGQAAKAERAAKAAREAQFKAPPQVLLNQKEQGPPNLGLTLPSKQEKYLREIEEANRIKRPTEEPQKVVPKQTQEAPRTTATRGSGGEAQNRSEQLKGELASLEDQYNRRKNLEARRFNDLGQRLLGYYEGFAWCPECQYVSNIGLTSELRHNMGLRGCQRRSCKGCYQWPRDQSPCEEEEFLYEDPKQQKICEAYSIGREGCFQGNKCLDHHEKWKMLHMRKEGQAKRVTYRKVL
jgi:hypothetical protein